MSHPPRRDPAHVRPLSDARELLEHRAEVYQDARRELKHATAIGTEGEIVFRDWCAREALGMLDAAVRNGKRPFTHKGWCYSVDEAGVFHAEDLEPRRNSRVP